MQALKSIRAARRILPAQASLAVAAGECYDALGDLTRARREYAAAVAIDPTLAAPRLRLEALDRMELAAREMGSAMLQTEALRGWLAAPARVREAVEASCVTARVNPSPPAADHTAALVESTQLVAGNAARSRSIVLHPNVLSRVSRDGDPMVVLVAGEEEGAAASREPRDTVNLDHLVREALDEALDAPAWLPAV